MSLIYLLMGILVFMYCWYEISRRIRLAQFPAIELLYPDIPREYLYTIWRSGELDVLNQFKFVCIIENTTNQVTDVIHGDSVNEFSRQIPCDCIIVAIIYDCVYQDQAS
jgi:hypothetical protein